MFQCFQKALQYGIIHKVRTPKGWRAGPGKKHTGLYERFIYKGTYTIIFFLKIFYKIEVKYELFRQPELSIPISPIQLESVTSIPSALLGVLSQHFLINLQSSFFIL